MSRKPGSISADELRSHFRRRAGGDVTVEPRVRMPDLVTRWDVVRPSAALEREYGAFDIFVYDDPRVAEQATPPSVATGGVVWSCGEVERGPAAGRVLAFAQKRYGANVVVTWWPGGAAMEADERWERLDAVLSELAGGS